MKLKRVIVLLLLCSLIEWSYNSDGICAARINVSTSTSEIEAPVVNVGVNYTINNSAREYHFLKFVAPSEGTYIFKVKNFRRIDELSSDSPNTGSIKFKELGRSSHVYKTLKVKHRGKRVKDVLLCSESGYSMLNLKDKGYFTQANMSITLRQNEAIYVCLGNSFDAEYDFNILKKE